MRRHGPDGFFVVSFVLRSVPPRGHAADDSAFHGEEGVSLSTSPSSGGVTSATTSAPNAHRDSRAWTWWRGLRVLPLGQKPRRFALHGARCNHVLHTSWCGATNVGRTIGSSTSSKAMVSGRLADEQEILRCEHLRYRTTGAVRAAPTVQVAASGLRRVRRAPRARLARRLQNR